MPTGSQRSSTSKFQDRHGLMSQGSFKHFSTTKAMIERNAHKESEWEKEPMSHMPI